MELEAAAELRFPSVLFGQAARGATNVEGPHRELCSGFSNTLCGNHSDGIPHRDHLPTSEVTPIAMLADPMIHDAGQHGADHHLFQPKFFNQILLRFGDFRASRNGHPAFIIQNVLLNHPAQNPIPQAFNDLSRLDQGGHLNTVQRATVIGGDHAILCHVHQSPGEVSGVCGLERRVGQSFAGTVGGDEVLQNVQTLAEIRMDGGFDDLSRRFGHQPAHSRKLLHLLVGPPGSGVGHHEDRVHLVAALVVFNLLLQPLRHALGDALGGPCPDVNDLIVAFTVGDQPILVLGVDFIDPTLRLIDQRLFLSRDHHVVHADRETRPCRVAVADALDLIQHLHRLDTPGSSIGHVHQCAHLLFLEMAVDEFVRHLLRNHLGKQNPPHRGLDPLAIQPQNDPGVQVHLAMIIGRLDFSLAYENLALAQHSGTFAGDPVEPQHHVLRGCHHRFPVGRGEDVVGGHHQDFRLQLRLHRQRNMNRHLVSVKVGVERSADQRVELDRLALDQDRLKRLDAQAVQGWSTVEHHRMFPNHILQNRPDFREILVQFPLRILDGVHLVVINDAVVNERLEQLQRHALGESTLVELEVGPHDDHGSPGVVHALTKQVLAEAPLLALEHVRERLQWALVGTDHRASATSVVKEGVHRFLQHALLVLDDDPRCPQFDEPLEPVVAVDDAPIEVVEVARCKASPLQRHQRTQFRGQHRKILQNHRISGVPGDQQCGDNFKAFDESLAFGFRLGVSQVYANVVVQLVQVQAAQQGPNRFGPHAQFQIGVQILDLAVLFLLN